LVVLAALVRSDPAQLAWRLLARLALVAVAVSIRLRRMALAERVATPLRLTLLRLLLARLVAARARLAIVSALRQAFPVVVAVVVDRTSLETVEMAALVALPVAVAVVVALASMVQRLALAAGARTAS
jgi:hypothetical protein